MAQNEKKQLTPQTLTEEQVKLALKLAEEGFTLKKIAEELMISVSKLQYFRKKDPFFEQKFTSARHDGLEILADALIEIPEKVVDVQRARLMSDNYKWLLSKRKPEVYGDKLDLTVNHQIDIAGALQDAKQRVTRDVTHTLPKPDSDQDGE